jgi:predicted ArsR family transcriptional regulator
MHEARTEGAFGKEAFLRALVVEMSRTIEAHHGPDAAEAVIAQVGTDVGGQMETEYRVATEIVGALTPEQLGECYVRLKHAIDGQFSVVEATRERIVLENRRCPFGEAVRHAPALCRMTSSVFGGLAARNHPDGATVLLEERIAVGDPGCRVVVFLGPAPDDVAPFAHRYRAPRG